jgi:hypothetical protein
MIMVSALQIDKAVFFSTTIIVAAFIPLFTMQGVEGQIFNPMARTYAYALIGALIATFTVTPCGARPQQGSGLERLKRSTRAIIGDPAICRAAATIRHACSRIASQQI